MSQLKRYSDPSQEEQQEHSSHRQKRRKTDTSSSSWFSSIFEWIGLNNDTPEDQMETADEKQNDSEKEEQGWIPKRTKNENAADNLDRTEHSGNTKISLKKKNDDHVFVIPSPPVRNNRVVCSGTNTNPELKGPQKQAIGIDTVETSEDLPSTPSRQPNPVNQPPVSTTNRFLSESAQNDIDRWRNWNEHRQNASPSPERSRTSSPTSTKRDYRSSLASPTLSQFSYSQQNPFLSQSSPMSLSSRSGSPNSMGYRFSSPYQTQRGLSFLRSQDEKKRLASKEKILNQYLPDYKEAFSSGYSGTKRDYQEVAEYLAKVKQAQDKQAKEMKSLSRITPGADILVKKEEHEEVQWLKVLRERIEKALKPREPTEIPSVDTPTYRSLRKQDEELEKEIESLKLARTKKDRFKPLSSEAEQQVSDAMRSRGLTLCEAFAIPITSHDIQTLKDRTWLNDEIINFYGQLLLQRAKDHPDMYPPIHVFNTFFYKKLGEDGYTGVRRWTKRAKVDIFSKDYVLFPVHLGMHWTCAVINIKDKRFEYYDSLHSSNPTCIKLMKEYITQESKDKKNVDLDISDWEVYSPKSIPAQQNGYDCGMFTIMFMECRSRGAEFDFSQKHMPYLRRRIAYEIMNVKLLDSD